jgi:ketosteroid isomerase-like protein
MVEDKQVGVPEEKLESIIRDFVEAFTKKNVDRMMSFFTEDAVWVAPEGVFSGKDEVRRYLTWYSPEDFRMKLVDAGVGVVVKGNKAVFQYTIEATSKDGVKCVTPGVSVYEFSGERIQRKTAVFDRLSIANQAAKGGLDRWVMGVVLGRLEKGLH